MSNKPRSRKVIRDEKRKANFVGRTEYLQTFSNNYESEEPEYVLFAISGEGGVGKSTLVEQYVTMVNNSDIQGIALVCDEKYSSPVSVMGYVAEELAKQGIRHKEFDDRYKKYREKRQEIENDPNTPRSVIDLLSRGVTDFAVKSLRKTPGAGVFFEGIDEKAAGEALAERSILALAGGEIKMKWNYFENPNDF